jgi:hypothetical protein
MEESRKGIAAHVSTVSSILREVCEAPTGIPLVAEKDWIVGIVDPHIKGVSRAVTNELGRLEPVLRLPIPDAEHPRLWFGLHERWEPVRTKRRARFCACGLRIYAGGKDERAAQILRLEWAAPTPDKFGTLEYDGGHAAHPHWHIDRSALVDVHEYLRLLEGVSKPGSEAAEKFDEGMTSHESDLAVRDYSWMHQIHLPALARWVEHGWDGKSLPGPHQSEPDSAAQLANWWAGSLRYLRCELSAKYVSG